MHARVTLAVAAALYAGAAFADDWDFYPPVDLQVRFSDHEFELDYGAAGEVDTRVKRASLHWRERYGERVQIGIIGGYSGLTQTGNAATAGLEPQGYHAGFTLDVDLYRSTRLLVRLGAAYVYQKVDHKEDDDTIELAWDTPSAELGAAFQIGNGLWLQGAARYQRLEGEQRRRGTVDETLDIERQGETSGVLGLEYRTQDDGYIGISVESGFEDSVAVYFGRHY